ncbi:unnamed protein product [Rhodiola kirilowii]
MDKTGSSEQQRPGWSGLARSDQGALGPFWFKYDAGQILPINVVQLLLMMFLNRPLSARRGSPAVSRPSELATWDAKHTPEIKRIFFEKCRTKLNDGWYNLRHSRCKEGLRFLKRHEVDEGLLWTYYRNPTRL